MKTTNGKRTKISRETEWNYGIHLHVCIQMEMPKFKIYLLLMKTCRCFEAFLQLLHKFSKAQKYNSFVFKLQTSWKEVVFY